VSPELQLPRRSIGTVDPGCEAGVIGLRVDVCNRRALEQGVPPLLSLFARANVRATFFVTFGPDRSGLAIRRLLEPGFVAKMLRTRAWRLYGLRTLLSGTLLTPRAVGEDFPETLRSIEADGHELAIHGWDHSGWIQDIETMHPDVLRDRFTTLRQLFKHAVDREPCATAAPGWRCSEASLRVQDTLGFRYASDCRGRQPFRPKLGDTTFRLVQIPTSLPTSDELLGGLRSEQLPDFYMRMIRTDPIPAHVLAVHAEAEGLAYSGWLHQFLEQARAEGFRICPLEDLAARTALSCPVLKVEWRHISGRAGPVSLASDGPAPSTDAARG